MSIHVNVRMFKIMHTVIKVGICTSATYAICQTLITEERQNKTKYLIWNSIRLMFVKKISMPNSVISIGYIKSYSSRSCKPIKSPGNSIWHKCHKICYWSRKPKTILETKKNQLISLADQQVYYLQVFQRLY